MVIFQWKPSINVIPTIGDVFLAGPTAVVDVLSMYNQDTRQMYNILYDKCFEFVGDSTAGLATSISARNQHFKRTIPAKHLQFLAGTTDSSNGIWMYIVSDSGVPFHPTIAWTAMLYFTDS